MQELVHFMTTAVTASESDVILGVLALLWLLHWLPLSLLVYLFLHDTWFYWTHRWMHRPRVFRLAHAVHHASKPPCQHAAGDDRSGPGVE